MTGLPDGCYFNLDFAAYHAERRLSASGICNLLISPATFWARSWLNADRDDDDTPARIAGRAYHCAKLEPDKFLSLYARAPSKDDFPDAPITHADIKAALKDLGRNQTVGGNESVLEAAHRLRDAGYEGPIWHLELEAFEAEHGNKTPLGGELFDRIVASSEQLRLDPDIGRLLEDGFPEVSILWTSKSGTKWKARLDWLSASHIADLKTFENAMGKPLHQCLADAVRFNRYYIPGVLYWQALELVRQGQVFICGAHTAAQSVLVADIQKADAPLEYWWVFQEKGGIPNVLARQFRMTAEAHPHHLYQAPDDESRAEFAKKLRRPSMLFNKAVAEIEHAERLYRQAMEVWGEAEPWGAMVPVGEIGDDDFSPFWLEQ
jgi:hypothetical protein